MVVRDGERGVLRGGGTGSSSGILTGNETRAESPETGKVELQAASLGDHLHLLGDVLLSESKKKSKRR